MQDIHLIEKSALYNRVTGDEWETGTWTMSAETANSLIGGTVYLHTAQKAPCFLGGKIYKCAEVGEGRYSIYFNFDKNVVGTTTQHCKNNWSVEMLLEPVTRV